MIINKLMTSWKYIILIIYINLQDLDNSKIMNNILSQIIYSTIKTDDYYC